MTFLETVAGSNSGEFSLPPRLVVEIDKGQLPPKPLTVS
jgi:hypothetical protein